MTIILLFYTPTEVRSETNSLVYEIFHKMDLYDLCLEILLITRLEKNIG